MDDYVILLTIYEHGPSIDRIDLLNAVKGNDAISAYLRLESLHARGVLRIQQDRVSLLKKGIARLDELKTEQEEKKRIEQRHQETLKTARVSNTIALVSLAFSIFSIVLYLFGC